MMLKAVILIGGPSKGSRFRPLLLDVPKPLFPVAGFPMIQHHIEACVKIPDLKEIIILGFYSTNDMSQFVGSMALEYKIKIRYLQEFAPLGTAGGLYHFRDQILSGNPDFVFVLNDDVCGDFPLQEILDFHCQKTNRTKPVVTLLAAEATRQQSVTYGCIVENKYHEVEHYVEKPSTFISTLINGGVYIFSPEVFQTLADVYHKKQAEFISDEVETHVEREALFLEKEILAPLAGTGKALVFQTKKLWSQLKTPAAAIYANRQYLQLYRRSHPERLSNKNSPNIIGDVYIHPTATVDPTAVIGPNVSIGHHAVICAGVRIKESIILPYAKIHEHSLVLYSMIGSNADIGSWTRIEGTPCDPNPDKPFTKIENVPLFNDNGQLNPSITIIGCHVSVRSEVIVRNCVVVARKKLIRSFSNEIIL